MGTKVGRASNDERGTLGRGEIQIGLHRNLESGTKQREAIKE